MKEIKIMETNDIIEANIIKSRLEADGITVLLKGESIGGTYPITVDGWGKIRIYVSEEDENKARERLKGMKSDD